MDLKDIFSKGENGTLTYDQFAKIAEENKLKFVDLSEGNYVDKQKYTDDLAARDTRITSLDDTLKAREGDLSTLKKQLEDAGENAEKLGELTTAITDLQKKYDKDTKAYQKQIQDQAYKHAVTDFANSQKFTSQAAKRDFINSMMAKELQMEGDTLIGANDFVTAYAKDNEDAFVVEASPNEGDNSQNQNLPHFVDSTNGSGNGGGGESTPFKFDFLGVRAHEEK